MLSHGGAMKREPSLIQRPIVTGTLLDEFRAASHTFLSMSYPSPNFSYTMVPGGFASSLINRRDFVVLICKTNKLREIANK